MSDIVHHALLTIVAALVLATGVAGQGLFGQLFDPSGTFTGEEFQLNSYTTDGQTSPALAVGRAGEFVATWISQEQDGDSSGVFGRRFAVPIFTDGFESGDTSAWSSAIP